MLSPSSISTAASSLVDFRWVRIGNGRQGTQVKVTARTKDGVISTSEPVVVEACTARISLSLNNPGTIGLCLESLDGLQLTPMLHVLVLPGDMAQEVNNLFMVSVEGYRKHMLENNPAAFLLRDKDVESSAWNQHFHLMIVAVGEFLEAPEKLSSAGSTNFSNVMQYLVSNEVYSVAQYLLNTAVDAGHVLMWNGEPLQQSNIDLATFQRSAME